jgi:hypothetical protein
LTKYGPDFHDGRLAAGFDHESPARLQDPSNLLYGSPVWSRKGVVGDFLEIDFPKNSRSEGRSLDIALNVRPGIRIDVQRNVSDPQAREIGSPASPHNQASLLTGRVLSCLVLQLRSSRQLVKV